MHARFGRGHTETDRCEPARRRVPTLRHQLTRVAGAAPDVREASIDLPAGKEGLEFPLDECRYVLVVTTDVVDELGEGLVNDLPKR